MPEVSVVVPIYNVAEYLPKCVDSILAQASILEQVPDIFWYRMFESFKFMLYKTRRLNCTADEYADVLDQLEEYVKDLLPYAEKIVPFYKKYSRRGSVEKARDRLLLNPHTERIAFRRLKRKMCHEFAAEKKK